MATECLFREDAYLKECEATVAAVTGTGGIVLDRTVFYAMSGGQPADRGTFTLPDGQVLELRGKSGEAVWTDAGAHLPKNLEDQPFEVMVVELKSPAHEGHE